MGKIGLHKCHFFAKHGYYPREREEGNEFEVSVSVYYDISDAARSDALEESLNYENLHEEVKKVMEGPSVHLLEHLAHEIIKAIKARFSVKGPVVVKVEKLNPPIDGDVKSAWVELEG